MILSWRDDPDRLKLLLNHESRHNLALRRRMAILDVVEKRGFVPRDPLIAAVEAATDPGIFGASPYARLWSDMRALRAAGFVIKYNRHPQTRGYHFGVESIGEPLSSIIQHVFSEIDFEHLDRVAKASPARRVEAVFEMTEFMHEVNAAGRKQNPESE